MEGELLRKGVVFDKERGGMAVLLPALSQVISSHAEKECGQGAAGGVEASCVANQGHENLLRDVLSNCCIAAHMQGKPENRGMPAPVKQRKGIFVSGNHAPEEAVVG